MNRKNILIVSGHQLRDESVNNWAGFDTIFAPSEERAIELANRQLFDLAVIDHTSTAIDQKKLLAVLPILQPDMKLLKYKGEPLQELKNKVAAVFIRQKNERIKRYLVLDSSQLNPWSLLPPFSAN